MPKPYRRLLENELLSRAEGVFLWVKPTIDMLENIVDGASPTELLEKLKSIPVGLDELYTRIPSGIPAEERKEAQMMFQWAVLAESPLGLEDFRYDIAISKYRFSLLEGIEESDRV